jgi:hypothetical protein
MSNDTPITEAQREIQQQALDDLADANVNNISVSFYFTSIYDHSIFEAFSKVVQKLIPQLPTLENLLDVLISVRLTSLAGLTYIRMSNCIYHVAIFRTVAWIRRS